MCKQDLKKTYASNSTRVVHEFEFTTKYKLYGFFLRITTQLYEK